VCLLDQAGDTRWHRHRHATPEALLKALAPDRAQIVMAADGRCTWYGLADVCAAHRSPVVLGHALDLQARHGGTATHDTIDAHNMAVLLRGGRLPQASVSPAERRATRDRLRRRLHLARQRGDLRAPGHNTNSQSKLPAIGHKIADTTNRDGVAARGADPAVHKSRDVDLARIGSDAARRRDLDLTLVNTATHHAAHPRELRHTVPGLGTILRRVRRDESHPIARCPRGPDFAAYGRRVTGAKASAGQRCGTSGTKIGHAHRTWAFSEAAVFGVRDQPAGQQWLASWEKQQRQGNAVTILAQKLARAGYSLVKQKTAFARHTCLNGYGRGVGALDASRDDQGMPLTCSALHEPHDGVTERR
jgi:hypothetical protein